MPFLNIGLKGHSAQSSWDPEKASSSCCCYHEAPALQKIKPVPISSVRRAPYGVAHPTGRWQISQSVVPLEHSASGAASLPGVVACGGRSHQTARCLLLLQRGWVAICASASLISDIVAFRYSSQVAKPVLQRELWEDNLAVFAEACDDDAYFDDAPRLGADYDILTSRAGGPRSRGPPGGGRL